MPRAAKQVYKISNIRLRVDCEKSAAIKLRGTKRVRKGKREGEGGGANEFNNPWTEWRVCKQFARIERFIITGQSFKASQ